MTTVVMRGGEQLVTERVDYRADFCVFFSEGTKYCAPYSSIHYITTPLKENQ